MKVLLISAVYPPEPVVSARLSADLREHLLEGGHEVRVLCPLPSRGVRADDAWDASRDGAGVVRLGSYRSPASRLVGRLRESWDLGRRAARWMRAPGRERFDVVYANVWPLFGPWEIARAAGALGIPFVLHVQDVYPESLGTKLSPRAYRFVAPPLLALDRALTRRCAAVVLISERIRRHYAGSRGIGDRARVVRNWVDAAQFLVTHDRRAVCAEYGIPDDRFTFLYLGNLSPVSAVDSMIRAFATVPRAGMQLVIVGEGAAKERCARLISELRLENVLLRSEPDAGKVARVQSMADVFLLPTLAGVAASSTPSKCISYMFSGKPILAAVDAESDAADDLREAGCGWICAPEAIAAIGEAMGRCASIPVEEREAKGRSARRYAERTFGKGVGVGRLAGLCEAAGAGRGA